MVEGEKMVKEAIDSSFTVDAVYRMEEIGEQAMSRITMLKTPSPVLAVVRQRRSEVFSMKGNGLYLALDVIQDPGNFGTIMRIADWFALDGIFSATGSVDLYNPKTVQSTMGAIFRVPVSYCSLEETIGGCGTVYGTFLDGEDIYKASIEKKGPAVIVVGNESAGISPQVALLCNRRLTVPPVVRDGCGSESLNAAAATAIVVSEFRRRGF